MDIFYFDNVKAEKTNAMLMYRRLRTVTNLFRFAEFCLALVFFSYISTHLPCVVKLSGEYSRLLISIIVKPVFVFVVSNIIILALLFKSSAISAGDNAEAVLIKEFAKNRNAQAQIELKSQTEEIVYQDKQIIKTNSIILNCEKDDTESVTIVSNSDAAVIKNFRRTKSEKLKCEPVGVLLRRSETEKIRTVRTSSEAEFYSVDEMSNEDFQRTIEAFIEKQVTFHLRERFAVVPQQKQIKIDGQ